MFSIVSDVSGFGFLDKIAAHFLDPTIAPSVPSATSPSQPTAKSLLPDPSAPLNILANDIAILVMGYANEFNVFASGNDNAQKHKDCSPHLIKYLSDDHKIFTKISETELDSINAKDNTEKLIYICEKRLKDINSAVGTIVDQDFEEKFYPEVSQLKKCCTLYQQAKDCSSLHPKIYAICYSIELFTHISKKYDYNFPDLKNCLHDPTETIRVFLILNSGHEIAQNIKDNTPYLIKYLLDDRKIFTKISNHELNSVNTKDEIEKLSFICEKRLRDIRCIVGEIVSDVVEYNEGFYPEVNHLKRCCDLLEGAGVSCSLDTKIYAINHSIKFLTYIKKKYSLNIPHILENCNYDRAYILKNFRKTMEG